MLYQILIIFVYLQCGYGFDFYIKNYKNCSLKYCIQSLYEVKIVPSNIFNLKHIEIYSKFVIPFCMIMQFCFIVFSHKNKECINSGSRFDPGYIARYAVCNNKPLLLDCYLMLGGSPTFVDNHGIPLLWYVWENGNEINAVMVEKLMNKMGNTAKEKEDNIVKVVYNCKKREDTGVWDKYIYWPSLALPCFDCIFDLVSNCIFGLDNSSSVFGLYNSPAAYVQYLYNENGELENFTKFLEQY